jgi:hypothetical protein
MTDTKKAALSAALEFWRSRPSRDYHALSQQFPPPRPADYAPEDVVRTAEVFAAFLDGEKPAKRTRR